MANVVNFIIGLSIIIGASILNAAGLNLSKLDHMRNSRSGRKEWQRPLLICGMGLYCISQLIGSTLALEYMRAEYVAPLGSTSLIFNFVFARFLVGTQITSYDIWGTIVIIVGVCGIVGFGSWNSGIKDEMDLDRLTSLWRRGPWLAYFLAMAGVLIALLIVSGILEAILSAREQLTSSQDNSVRRPLSQRSGVVGFIINSKIRWDNFILWLTERIEAWTSSSSDKQIAWTLGILWPATGGGLAGGTLVFAKVCVKLLSGTLSHKNTGNQFGHAAPIFTIILTCITAVMQIICLNRGLRIYDSTIVVPVFYSIYTGMGWLNSLIFNNEVDAYHGWTLFLIFLSMVILIAGVVLLTHKKPDASPPGSAAEPSGSKRVARVAGSTPSQERLADLESGEQETLWAVGDASDDEDDGKTPRASGQFADEDDTHAGSTNPIKPLYGAVDQDPRRASGEGQRLMDDDEEEEPENLRSPSLIDVPLSR